MRAMTVQLIRRRVASGTQRIERARRLRRSLQGEVHHATA